LVIEGGTNNDMPTIALPALFLTHLMPTSKTNIFYKANKEKQLANRELIVPSGGVLGGGSSTNLMMYSRAQRSDFDSWKVPGWSADEMLPYLKRVFLMLLKSHNGKHQLSTFTARDVPRSRLERAAWL
jgi:alcohol oxidase